MTSPAGALVFDGYGTPDDDCDEAPISVDTIKGCKDGSTTHATDGGSGRLSSSHVAEGRRDVPDVTASAASRPHRILFPLSVTSLTVACVHRIKARRERAHVRVGADVPRSNAGPDAQRETRSTSWSRRPFVGVHESAMRHLFQSAGWSVGP